MSEADTFRELCAAAVAAFDGPSGAADTALLAHRVDEWLERARAALASAPAPAAGLDAHDPVIKALRERLSDNADPRISRDLTAMELALRALEGGDG